MPFLYAYSSYLSLPYLVRRLVYLYIYSVSTLALRAAFLSLSLLSSLSFLFNASPFNITICI